MFNKLVAISESEKLQELIESLNVEDYLKLIKKAVTYNKILEIIKATSDNTKYIPASILFNSWSNSVAIRPSTITEAEAKALFELIFEKQLGSVR